MTFENTVVPEKWKDEVTFHLNKSKGDKGECINYRGIGMLNIIVKCMVES